MLKCNQCGADLIRKGNGRYYCSHCQTEYEDANDQTITKNLNIHDEAAVLREKRKTEESKQSGTVGISILILIVVLIAFIVLAINMPNIIDAANKGKEEAAGKIYLRLSISDLYVNEAETKIKEMGFAKVSTLHINDCAWFGNPKHDKVKSITINGEDYKRGYYYPNDSIKIYYH